MENVPLRGLMQDRPLLVSSLIDYAARFHGEREIVTRSVEGPIRRSTWADVARRARQVANALRRLRVRPGDRVATLAWNTDRHLELYYGVSGMGAVLHTVNPRLFEEQIAYIVNHAEDRVVFVDTTFLPLLERLAPRLESVEAYVVLADEEHVPPTSLPGALCYETLLAAEPADFDWPLLDERTASSLCYTSGTTGNPKGVLYSHRSTVLHAFLACARDALGLHSGDVVLPVVPMFHVNAWGIPYSGAMCGAKLVLPGAGMDPASLYELLDAERVTLAAGVPTVWRTLLDWLAERGRTLRWLERTAIGGSACPESMILALERDHDVRVVHAWGMTETSPIGTIGTMKPPLQDAGIERTLPYKLRQGRGMYGVELRIVDDEGRELPWDGRSCGHLQVRGPWVVARYFKDEGGEILTEDGWFDTGDIGAIDPEGFLRITDRAKDVIKSGGEWISSIDVENLVVAHPSVREAAVIGLPHPKWDERPLLVCVPEPGAELSREEVLAFLEGKIARWWMPDDVVFVEEIPHTATGKVSKRLLRERFAGHRWPGVAE